MLNKKPNHRRTFARHHPAMKIACIYNITYVAAVIARARLFWKAQKPQGNIHKSRLGRDQSTFIYIRYIYDKLWISKAVAGKVSHIHTFKMPLAQDQTPMTNVTRACTRAYTFCIYTSHTKKSEKQSGAVSRNRGGYKNVKFIPTSSSRPGRKNSRKRAGE